MPSSGCDRLNLLGRAIEPVVCNAVAAGFVGDLHALIVGRTVVLIGTRCGTAADEFGLQLTHTGER